MHARGRTCAHARSHASSYCQLIAVHHGAGGVFAVNHKPLFYGDKPFGSCHRATGMEAVS